MNIQVGDRVTYNTKYQKNCVTIIKDNDMAEVYKEDNKKGYIEILKIERPHYEVVEEKKELLTEEEREFLKAYIKIIESLNNGEIDSIIKNGCYITLNLKTGIEYEVDIGSKFKTMKECQLYTLKELGLEEK